MHYPQSSDILKLIEKSQNILINCHRSPDCDSAGSASALYEIVRNMGKNARIICPSPIPPRFSFLSAWPAMKTVSFSVFDFEPYDLLIFLDSSSEAQIADTPGWSLPKKPTIIIDHHATNALSADIRLVDKNRSSTAEMVFYIIKDCQIPITEKIATALYAGMESDTVSFHYGKHPAETLAAASELLASGAARDTIVRNIYNAYDPKTIRLMGELLTRLRIDRAHRFAGIAAPRAIVKKATAFETAKELISNYYIQSMNGIDFGYVAVEQEPNVLSVSLRSTGAVNVAEIAAELGGGGHPCAAGCRIRKPYAASLRLLRATLRKYAKTAPR